MSFSMDKAFGLPAAALKLQARRSQLLAENIANADTPNFKALDIDFRAAMQQVQASGSDGLRTTNVRHLTPAAQSVGNPSVRYRVPANPSLDGNTVEMPTEQSRFAETNVNYQSALTFLGNRIQGLIGAIKGE